MNKYKYKNHRSNKRHNRRRLVIAGTCKECNAIIDRLIAEEPSMTIAEYLNKHNKDILILR